VGANNNTLMGPTINDFVSLGLRNGYPEFRYDVGTGSAILISPKPVTLGEWHTVRISREKRNGTLTILNNKGNNESIVRGSVPDGRLLGLDLRGPLYLGSVPTERAADNLMRNDTLLSIVRQQTGLRNGFVGCISRLVTSGKVVNDISPVFPDRSSAKDTSEASSLRVSTQWKQHQSRFS